MALYFKDGRGWHEIFMWRREDGSGLIAEAHVQVAEAEVPADTLAALARNPSYDGPIDGQGRLYGWRETADLYQRAKSMPPPGYREERLRDLW